MELNRDQIIKALECCINDECDKCGRTFGNCQANLMTDALALIKELTEENEKLARNLHQTNTNLHEVKSDTVSKMRSMIKEKCIRFGIYPAFVKEIVERVAEEILEETQPIGGD